MKNKFVIIALVVLVLGSAYLSLSNYSNNSEKVYVNSSGVIKLSINSQGRFDLTDFWDRINRKIHTPKNFSSDIVIKRYDQKFNHLPNLDVSIHLNDIQSKNDSIGFDKSFLGNSFVAFETYPNAKLARLNNKSEIGFIHNDYFKNTKGRFDPKSDSIGFISNKEDVFYFNVSYLDPNKTILTLPIDKIHAKCNYELIDYREGKILISVTDNSKALNPETSLPQFYLVTINNSHLDYLRLPLDTNKPKVMKPRFIGNELVIYVDATELNRFIYYSYEPSKQLINMKHEAKIPDIDIAENQFYFDPENKIFYLVIVYKDGRMICSFQLYDTEASIVSEFRLR